MKIKDQIKLMNKMGFKIETKVKYLGITMINTKCMLFQNNHVKTWNEVKKDVLRWEKLPFLLLGRISMIKINVLPRIMFLP